MPGLLLVPDARAEPPVNMQIEINFLLGYVNRSGCGFYRNGICYDSQKTQVHQHDKYNKLVAGNLINTTDFIKNAATASNLGGQPYAVRCKGGATVTSNHRLHDELERFRTF